MPSSSLRSFSLIAAGFLSSLLVPSMSGEGARESAANPAAGQATPPGLTTASGKLPLFFEANRGQSDAQVRFLSRGKGYNLLLSLNEAALELRRPAAGKGADRLILRMKLLGARSNPRVTGIDELPGRTNYLLGSRAGNWRAGISTYARVRYEAVYPGVDLIYHGSRGELEYDFVIAPGADPWVIRLEFEGAQNLEVDASGDLVLRTAAGQVRQRRPTIYQEWDGIRQEVAGRYLIHEGRRVTFSLGHYDRSRSLVIDPHLVYATSLYDGSSGGTREGSAIAVDAAGYAYVTGRSMGDAFVAKLTPDGSAFVYYTYLGGAGDDAGTALALDPDGSVYVTGFTRSTDFPTMRPLQKRSGDFSDAFVAKLSPEGSRLIYATYFGGSIDDAGQGIAVDRTGSVTVTGSTTALDFPTTPRATQPLSGGAQDAFVARLNRSGSALVYATYLGGGGEEQGLGIALDAAGNAHVTGRTSSADFPLVEPLQTAIAGSGASDQGDAFAAKLTHDGSSLLYSTYLGGSEEDSGQSIAVDSTGAAYVAGVTRSADFPSVGALQARHGGGTDAFVVKIDAAGSALAYSTFLGGSGDDTGSGIAVEGTGRAHVLGTTSSPDFHSGTPARSLSGSRSDAFVAAVDPDGAGLSYAILLGGSGEDTGRGIALSSAGDAHVTGLTMSGDFVSVNALRPVSGIGDPFVARISTASSFLACPGTINFDNSSGDGLWQDPNNWDSIPARLPGGADNVCIGASSDVTLSSGTHTINSLTAEGGLRISGGSLSLATTSQISGDFTLDGGTLTGAGNLTIGGLFTWTGGTMSGTGATSANGGIDMVMGFGKTLNRPLNNAGTATLGGPGTGAGGVSSLLSIGSSGIFNNLTGSLFDIQNDQGVFGSSGTFHNNTGATLRRSAGTGDAIFQAEMSNQGSVELLSGSISFSGGYTQTAGATILDGGTLVTSTALQLQGGTLSGSGTITGSVTNSGGQVSPGLSPGALEVTGDYGQGSTAAYSVEIGGTAAGTQFDQLNKTGTGTTALGGELDVSLINSFNPRPGDSFTIMTFPSRTGAFSATNLPGLGGGLTWNVSHNATAVVLRVDSPATADMAVTKTDSPDPVVAGSSLTYTVTVPNLGPDGATGIVLTDTLPPDVTFGSASASQGSCSHVSGTVTCNLGTLAASTSAVATIMVVTPGTASASLINSASVTAAEADPVTSNNTVIQSTTVNAQSADMSITKTDSPDPVNVSTALAYTLIVSNGGPNAASSVTVTDTLPAGVGFEGASGGGWTCSHASGIVTCMRAALAIGVAPPITISLTAPASDGTFDNTATVTSAISDPSLTNNTDSESTTVGAGADLSITKSDGPDPAHAGAALTYTLSITNAGPGVASSVSVVDTLPAGTTFDSASGAGWSCSHATGIVTCTRASLSVGAAPDILLIASAPSNGGLISNSAVVAAATVDPSPANNTAMQETTVTSVADLSITKTDSPDPVQAGAPLTYLVTVRNLGPSPAASISVVDTLPVSAVFLSATGLGWACSHAAGTVTCTRAGLILGEGDAISIRAAAPPGAGLITNTVSVGSDSVDPNPTDNSASQETTVSPASADLMMTKYDLPDPVAAGATMTYRLRVGNLGPNTAHTVIVSDALPASVSFVSVTGFPWDCSHASGTVTCARTSSLTPGNAQDIVITVKAPASAGMISNTASVTATTPDLSSANNTMTQITTVKELADLSIIKSDATDPVAPSGALAYTLDVSNAGPAEAASVSVTDVLPAGVSFASASGTGWSCSHTTPLVTCTRSTLAVGPAPAIMIHVTAPGIGGSISNSAAVASATPDPSLADNTDVEDTIVNPPPASADLSITKSGGPDPVLRGAQLIYTLAILNAGPAAARGLTVTDTLPPEVEFISSNPPPDGPGPDPNRVLRFTNLGDLAVSSSRLIEILVRCVTPTTGLTNVAGVASSTSDPDASDNSASTRTVCAGLQATLRFDQRALNDRTLGEAPLGIIRLTGDTIDPLSVRMTRVNGTPIGPIPGILSGTRNDRFRFDRASTVIAIQGVTRVCTTEEGIPVTIQVEGTSVTGAPFVVIDTITFRKRSICLDAADQCVRFRQRVLKEASIVTAPVAARIGLCLGAIDPSSVQIAQVNGTPIGPIPGALDPTRLNRYLFGRSSLKSAIGSTIVSVSGTCPAGTVVPATLQVEGTLMTGEPFAVTDTISFVCGG